MFPPHKSIQVFLLTTGRAPLKDRRPMSHSSVFKFLHISGAPFGSDFWPRKSFGAQAGGKLWNRYVFGIHPYVFWRRKNSGAQTGWKIMESIGFWYSNPIHFWRPPSRIRYLAPNRLRSPNGRKIMESIGFWYSILYISGTPLGSHFWFRKSFGAQTGRK